MPQDHGVELRSLVRADGTLQLSLADVPIPEPGPDEVLVRVEASPINPSDLGVLIGPADVATLRSSGSAARPVLIAAIPPQAMSALAARLDKSMVAGNEGAGVVVRAGASPTAQALIGRTVAMAGGGMYAQYRCLRAADVLPLPTGATPAEGASSFVNPLTALGMVETMRSEGHKALVHTAAASNLGQMLVRICKADGVPLVNIVRSAEQEQLLRGQGAEWVVDSTGAGFFDKLADAVTVTGATLAFDAIGGGRVGSQILSAMEAAASGKTTGTYNHYGSSVHKQLYIYGRLDTGPTELVRDFGFAWGVGGWLLTPFLKKIGPERVRGLRQRVANELRTTFASHYAAEIGLAEALDPKVTAVYARRATGAKYLINPQKGLSC